MQWALNIVNKRIITTHLQKRSFDLFVVPQLTNTKQRSSIIIFLISTPLFISHLTHIQLLHQLYHRQYLPYLKYCFVPQYPHIPAVQYATNINVIRISSSLKSINETSILKAKTTPLYFLLFFFFSRLENGY